MNRFVTVHRCARRTVTSSLCEASRPDQLAYPRTLDRTATQGGGVASRVVLDNCFSSRVAMIATIDAIRVLR